MATTTVDGNRLARWWAIAAPYENSNVPCAPPLRVRGMIGRRHTRVPPYGGYESAVHIHEIFIPRSAATWQSVPLMWCCAGGYGLPHQCAHWFAMTRIFEDAVRDGGGVWSPRPTESEGARCRRVVGEIGEAPPVAEEASRFRGSAPIGDHDSGRESVGTMVGNRRPLRRAGECGVCRAAAHMGAALQGVTGGAANRAG